MEISPWETVCIFKKIYIYCPTLNRPIQELVGYCSEPLALIYFGKTYHNSGGESIYGEKFADEDFTVKHTKPFLVWDLCISYHLQVLIIPFLPAIYGMLYNLQFVFT